MANCQKEFLRFDKNLDLTISWFNRLKSAQRAIEKQLHTYFDPLPGFTINRIHHKVKKAGDTNPPTEWYRGFLLWCLFSPITGGFGR